MMCVCVCAHTHKLWSLALLFYFTPHHSKQEKLDLRVSQTFTFQPRLICYPGFQKHGSWQQGSDEHLAHLWNLVGVFTVVLRARTAAIYEDGGGGGGGSIVSNPWRFIGTRDLAASKIWGDLCTVIVFTQNLHGPEMKRLRLVRGQTSRSLDLLLIFCVRSWCDYHFLNKRIETVFQMGFVFFPLTLLFQSGVSAQSKPELNYPLSGQVPLGIQ